MECFCWLCEQETDSEHYCYGCGEHICDDCDSGLNSPSGQHHPSAHEDVYEEDK